MCCILVLEPRLTFSSVLDFCMLIGSWLSSKKAGETTMDKHFLERSPTNVPEL